MENIIWVVLLCAVLALLFAAWKTSAVSKADAGTERMKEIAGNISDGARAFLFAEYKILVIFVAVLFVLIGLFITWLTAGCFLIGAVFSVCAGYVGMNVATKANVRTAAAAKSSGMNKALGVAFSGGSVMGMCVVGLGLLGCAAIYAFTGNVEILTGFSLGASSIALFGRVGGGIYTKAADVGADLVGKVEAGIPEDDPRNPAVIADNVGDNVGDVAGMGADLFESYVGSLVSALTLGAAAGAVSGVLYPLAIAGCGLIASIIGTFFVKGDENSNPQKALTKGSYAASIVVIVVALVLSNVLFGKMSAAIAVIAGLVVGALCQKSRMCMVAGIRDLVLFKDWKLLLGFVTIIVAALIGNLVTGNFHLGFTGQPVAHADHLWNFMGMLIVGFGSVLLGGCPLRQLILTGEGNTDSAITVLGYIVGAAFSHNFGLAGAAANAESAGGASSAGKVAVIIGLIVMLAVAAVNTAKAKKA